MVVLIELLSTYAPYIYAVCGLVALYQLYRLAQVRADRRQAVFSLERNRALRQLYGIFTVAMALLLAMGITYFASSTLPRAVASESGAGPEARPTLPPQFSLQIVPTNTPLFVTPSPTPTETVTPTPLPVEGNPESQLGTPLPETPALEPTAPPAAAVVAAPAACPDPRSAIVAPGNGATVGGVFSLIGTASHEQFNFYKVEFAPGANAGGGFTYLADGRGQVFNGALANVDSRSLANGPWTFQLTVVDLTGNYPEPCRVTINVQN